MKRLRACDGCKRHVFASERACPFCQTELEPAPERVLVPVPSTASRAQRLALAAALGTQGLVACAGDEGVAVPIYGAPVSGFQAPPPAGSSAPAAGRGGTVDGGIATPVYGLPVSGQPAIPPPQPRPRPDAGAIDEDSGVDEGMGGASGAAAGAGGLGGNIAAPVYGAPIPEYGAPPPPPPED